MPKLHHTLCCAILGVGLACCGGGETTPAPQQTSSLLARGGAAWAEVRVTQSATFLGAGVQGPAAWSAEGTLLELQEAGAMEYGALPDATHVLTTLVLADRSLLISTDAGLLLHRDGAISSSPLSGAFGALPPTSMARRGASLWMANELGVHHHEEGALVRAREGLGEGPYHLSAGPTPRQASEREVIWVGSSRGVFALERDGEGFARYASLEGRAVQALRATSDEHLWALSDKELLVRTPQDAAWSKLTVPGEVTWIGAHPASADLWIRTSEGQTHHYAEGTLTRVQGDPWAEVSWVDAEGRLLIATEAGVVAHERRYAVRLGALPSALSQVTSVDVSHSFPKDLTELKARVGDRELTIDAEGRVQLDPAMLGPGAHELVATATYRDGVQAIARARTSVSSEVEFTWDAHIAPLFEERCAKCHGVRASRELYLREQWEADFDNVYEQVERGLMPLPPLLPLDAGELKMLRDWRDAGFRP